MIYAIYTFFKKLIGLVRFKVYEPRHFSLNQLENRDLLANLFIISGTK